MRTSIRLIAAAALSVLALAGCGGSGDGESMDHSGMDHSTMGRSESSAGAATTAGGSATGAPAKAAITISDFAFSPATLTVAPGATITVTNKDAVKHDVDSADRTSFSTDPVGEGGTFTFTAPMKPGTYGYFCSVHPNMKGTLIVA